MKSILGQSLGDFELLILDDGSTDSAVTELAALGDARIRILGDAVPQGLAARLNQGIDAARGQYIARMDADDYAFPQRLEKQAQFLGTHGDVDLVGCRAVVFREGQGAIGLLPFAGTHDEICAQIWRGIPLPHPTWMGRAAWFRRFRYAMPEVKRAEDQELLLRAYAGSRFACLDDVLLAYRQGAFDLAKTLTARWHLLCAQQKYFLAHRQWGMAGLNLLLTSVKIAVDLLAALPGCDKLFFARMQGDVPDGVRRQLDAAGITHHSPDMGQSGHRR